MHKGKRYVVSCRQLDMPPTKEGSYVAANQWWRQRLAEIELEPRRVEKLNKEFKTKLDSTHTSTKSLHEFYDNVTSFLLKPKEEGPFRIMNHS